MIAVYLLLAPIIAMPLTILIVYINYRNQNGSAIDIPYNTFRAMYEIRPDRWSFIGYSVKYTTINQESLNHYTKFFGGDFLSHSRMWMCEDSCYVRFNLIDFVRFNLWREQEKSARYKMEKRAKEEERLETAKRAVKYWQQDIDDYRRRTQGGRSDGLCAEHHHQMAE